VVAAAHTITHTDLHLHLAVLQTIKDEADQIVAMCLPLQEAQIEVVAVVVVAIREEKILQG
jgi:hypothetical protein